MTFGLSAEMDIVAAPGTLRVAIRSNPRARLIHVAVAVIVTVIFLGLRTHLGYESILFGFILVVLWGSLASSETIEIDDEKLVIRRKNLGWTRMSEYEIDKCTDLRPNEKQNWIFSTALWCKVGGHVINFGQDMSYDQVAQLIVELKRNLPHAADQLLMRTDFTTLNLS
jgi:hypothetical protein